MKRQTAGFTHTRRPMPKASGWFSLLGRALARIGWRRTPDLLATFNDRMLADIGLTRGQIGHETRHVSLIRISQAMWMEGRHPGDSRNPTD